MNSFKLGSILSQEEDRYHEFKGHRNLAVEELPRWAFIPGTYPKRRSRTPVSRALNGFLNTGEGGTVYLGITDEGIVKGLSLSADQIRHVRVSLADLMSRYSPRVPKTRYKVVFCPIEGTVHSDSQLNDSGYTSDREAPPTTTSAVTASRPAAKSAHALRTSTYCWCDKEASDLYYSGVDMPLHIIMIRVLPFLPDPSVHKDTLQLAPLYQNEEGRCYIRKTNSVKLMSHQDVADFTRWQANEHFEKLLRRERSILTLYQNLYTSHLLSLKPLKHTNEPNKSHCSEPAPTSNLTTKLN